MCYTKFTSKIYRRVGVFCIIYNNGRASGKHGTVALRECAYAAGPGAELKLTRSSVQDPK